MNEATKEYFDMIGNEVTRTNSGLVFAKAKDFDKSGIYDFDENLMPTIGEKWDVLHPAILEYFSKMTRPQINYLNLEKYLETLIAGRETNFDLSYRGHVVNYDRENDWKVSQNQFLTCEITNGEYFGASTRMVTWTLSPVGRES